MKLPIIDAIVEKRERKRRRQKTRIIVGFVLKVVAVTGAVAGAAAGVAALVRKCKEKKEKGETCPLCEKVKSLLHIKSKDPVYYFESFDAKSENVIPD